VLDITAAVTLFVLDALDSIGRYHGAVSVPQAVIDAISEEIDEHRFVTAGRPSLITYKDGDTYYRHEVSAEHTAEMVESLERLRSQLRRLSVVGRPVASPVYVNPQVEDTLRAEFADAIAIAKAGDLL